MIRVRNSRRGRAAALAGVLAGALIAGIAVWSNVLGVGAGLELVAHRVERIVEAASDAPSALMSASPEPGLPSAPSPGATPGASPVPAVTLVPVPLPTAVPVRAKVDVNLLVQPAAHFITEIDHTWCAVAGTQMVLEIHGQASLTKAFQQLLASKIGEWETRSDSLNGGWGPAAIVAALTAYDVPGYEVRTYRTRADALRDAAVAISATHAPVILMAWYGAHTWVMTGYRATADPTVFSDATVTGAYILDPWYPRVSSIWGRSDPPGTYQDAAEMRRNYLPWKRPEGRYPGRDGLFIAVVPTVVLNR